MAEAPLYLTDESINAFYQFKLDSGVKSTAVAKYKNSFDNLIKWLGENRELTALRLQEWRQYLEGNGYSKNTVQGYVKRINDYLRIIGRQELCIPKPIRSDLTGRTFGYLTVLESTEKRQKRNVIWRCLCKCGNEVDVRTEMLLGGKSTSCGCLKKEVLHFANRYEEGTSLLQALNDQPRNPNSTSGYVGVSNSRGKWQANIDYKRKRHYLGTYANIEDAIKARARAKEAVMEDARRIYEETDHLYVQAPARPPKPEKTPSEPEPPRILPAKRSDNTSGYPGVYFKKGKWSVNLTTKGYRYRFGSYDRIEDAIAIRKKAEALVEAGDLETLKSICTNWQK